jgi:hypothetical protein
MMPDKTNKELALELQELRQFCVVLILGLRERGLSGADCDYWWEKLGSYQDVRQ